MGKLRRNDGAGARYFFWLLIFGPKNLPKLGKMFGKTINGFKKGLEDEEGSDDSEEKTEKKVSKKDEDEE